MAQGKSVALFLAFTLCHPGVSFIRVMLRRNAKEPVCCHPERRM
jgi:hypothetical protein